MNRSLAIVFSNFTFYSFFGCISSDLWSFWLRWHLNLGSLSGISLGSGVHGNSSGGVGFLGDRNLLGSRVGGVSGSAVFLWSEFRLLSGLFGGFLHWSSDGLVHSWLSNCNWLSSVLDWGGLVGDNSFGLVRGSSFSLVGGSWLLGLNWGLGNWSSHFWNSCLLVTDLRCISWGSLNLEGSGISWSSIGRSVSSVSSIRSIGSIDNMADLGCITGVSGIGSGSGVGSVCGVGGVALASWGSNRANSGSFGSSSSGQASSNWYWKVSNGVSNNFGSILGLLTGSACVNGSVSTISVWDDYWFSEFLRSSKSSWNVFLIGGHVSGIVMIEVPGVVSNNIWDDDRVSLNSILLLLLLLSKNGGWISWVDSGVDTLLIDNPVEGVWCGSVSLLAPLNLIGLVVLGIVPGMVSLGVW